MKVRGKRTSEDTVELMFAVSDTGIGIREEDMDKLYGAFERLDQKENHSVEGTGLGLSITMRMLELMQGHMEVASVYGEGSCFTVYLPQKVNAEGTIGSFEAKYHELAASMQAYRESFEAPDARVLVVDDNEMNLFVVTNLLKKTKIDITCCERGEKCLELVRENTYDMILLDHMMPGMDGVETMKRLRIMEGNLSKDAPVVVLTANAILGVREMYLQEGFDDYLSKPIESDKLEDLLKKYISKDKIRPVGSAGKSGQEVQVRPQMQQAIAPAQSREVQNADGTNKLLRGTIDVFLGLQYSAENAEMYREFLRMFCDMSKDKQKKMQECYAQESWGDYTVLVHALKSTSLSIGAKKLSEMALISEKAGKENQISLIRENHEALCKLYETTVQEGYQILDSEICV